MELIFPFKNIALNTLFSFFKKEKIKDFIRIKEKQEEWKNKLFNNDIQFFQDRLPNFENEILQIINTTNQETIDYYFEESSKNFNNLKNKLDKENFINNINIWNEEALGEYRELIEKKTKEYFQKEERKKYKHLEEYETYEVQGLYRFFNSNQPKKVKKVNYNYYCIEEKPDLIDLKYIDEYLELIIGLSGEFMDISAKYGEPWSEGNIKSIIKKEVILKPIVFCEGVHDITFIKKAANFLDKSKILGKIELRQRGSCNNLDNLWKILTQDNWETVPQTKILLYDCDTNRENKDFGHIFRRTIPSIKENKIKRGIENLFPNKTIEKAIKHKKEFVDLKTTKGTIRGIEYTEVVNVINKDEKKNFCEWVCENGTIDDFKNFNIVFNIIEKLV